MWETSARTVGAMGSMGCCGCYGCYGFYGFYGFYGCYGYGPCLLHLTNLLKTVFSHLVRPGGLISPRDLAISYRGLHVTHGLGT